MFRKLISVITAALLLFALCGCTLIARVEADAGEKLPVKKFEAECLHVPTPVPDEESSQDSSSDDGSDKGEEDETGVEFLFPQIKEDDPMYGDVSEMLGGLTPVFSYFAFKGEDMDLGSLDPEDFWLLMAMIAAEVDGDKKDADGNVALVRDIVSDYASTFFGDYFAAAGLPDWNGSVSASYDPAVQIYSLSAMALDGYHGRLAGFEASSAQPGFYDLYLEIYWSAIEGVQVGNDAQEALIWKISLEPRKDDAAHTFAFCMRNFERIGIGSNAPLNDPDAFSGASAD